MKVIVIVVLWIATGTLNAGLLHASIRYQYCDNYRDPVWAEHRSHNFAILFGPIGLLVNVLDGDYRFGWTLTNSPTTAEECKART